MKLYIVLVFFLFLFTTCNPERQRDPRCRFLADIGINEVVDLNLIPGTYLSPSTSVLVESPLHRGIIVTQVGYDYYAWDAANPNEIYDGSCKLRPKNDPYIFEDIIATSSCDESVQFNLVTGSPENNPNLQCSLIFYQVERVGNKLYISN